MSTINAEQLDTIYQSHSEEEGFERVLMKYKAHAVIQQLKGPRVLDIGCGVGSLCGQLARQVHTVVGLEGSPAKLARAKRLNAAPNIDYVCSLFEQWVPPCTFNSIVCTNVLEHVEDVPAFLQMCAAALSPAGRLILTVPNARGLHKRIGKHMGLIEDYFTLTDADVSKGHHRIYDRSRLHAELAAAGFDVQHIGGILLKPLSHRQMNDWEPSVVDALFEVGKELPDYCSSLIAVATFPSGTETRRVARPVTIERRPQGTSR